jgi:hypothetical protein
MADDKSFMRFSISPEAVLALLDLIDLIKRK